MDLNRKLRTSLLVAVSAFFILTVVLAVIQPQKPVKSLQRGINSPIIGLEMAFTPFEFLNIVGDPQSAAGQNARAAFAKGTYIDFAYILAYSLCYILLTWIMVFRQQAHWAFMLGSVLLIVIAAGSDAVENLALFRLLDAGSESLMEGHIDQLIVFTRLKWLALGIAGLPAVILFRREGRRGPAFLLTAAFALGALGVVKQYAVEYMSLFLAFFWVYLFIKLLPFKNRWWV